MPGPISFTLNPTTFSMDVDVKSIQVFTGGQYYIGHSTKPSQLTGQSEIVHVKYNNSAKNDRFFMVQDAVAFSFSEPVTFTGMSNPSDILVRV